MRWFAPQRSTQTISRLRCKEPKQFSRAKCAHGPRNKRLKEQRGSPQGALRSMTRSRSPFSNASRHEVLVKRGRPSAIRPRGITPQGSDDRWISPTVVATSPQDRMRLDMRIDSITKSYAVRAGLVTFLLLSISGRAIAVRDDSQQLTQVLGEARDEAAELARDADEMESLIRTDVSWQTHAVMLDHIKDHLNNMARIVAKLTETRTSGSELQEQAVGRILPLLKDLAINTTAAINYLNQNKSRPLTDLYNQYLLDNADTAHQLSSTVSSLFEYEKNMTKIAKLKNKLELSGQ